MKAEEVGSRKPEAPQATGERLLSGVSLLSWAPRRSRDVAKGTGQSRRRAWAFLFKYSFTITHQ